MNISIVIPVFNEEYTIAKLLKNIAQKVKSSNEILIIYDNKNDPTINAAKKYLDRSKQKNIFLIKNSIGNMKGITNAMKTGFSRAKGETVVAIMADLSDELEIVDLMFKKISDGADIVCGSRYMPGGKKIGGPILKTFLSKLAGLSLHYLFKLPTHDGTNAFKMYRKQVLDKIKIESTGGFEYSLEITLKAFKKGYKITEIPTIWYDRPAGKSSFRLLRWLPKYIKTYFIILKKWSIFDIYNKWRIDAATKISVEEHSLILFFSLLFSVLIYLFIVFSFHFSFSVPKTTAINWLTINRYPKQQDYYFLFSFLGFNFFSSILFWFIWVSLKIKKH